MDGLRTYESRPSSPMAKADACRRGSSTNLKLLKGIPMGSSNGIKRPQSACPVLQRAGKYEREEVNVGFLTRGNGIRKDANLHQIDCKVCVTPDKLEFGKILLGRVPKPLVLSIHNVGMAPCRFRLLNICDKTLQVQFPNDSNKVAPGMVSKVLVSWKPTSFGELSQTLILSVGEDLIFHILITGEAVDHLDRVVVPPMSEDVKRWMPLVPRLDGTQFNWQTEKLEIYRLPQAIIDPELSMDQIIEYAQKQNYDIRHEDLPPNTIRVFDETRSSDNDLDDQSEIQLDRDIYTQLGDHMNDTQVAFTGLPSMQDLEAFLR